jgi:DNA-binding MarR family transcriptional regulator
LPTRPPIIFLLYGAYQRAGQLVSLALAGTGIAPEDAAIYNVLERTGTVTPTQLGEALGMAPSTVTYRTKGLVERGHLERVDIPDDGRSAMLALTPAGLRAWREVLPGFVATLRAAEDRLEIRHVEAGRVLGALTHALDEELDDRRRERRRAERAARRSS